jgi:hypothetical protein
MMTEINDIKTALCLFFLHSGEISEDIADEKITEFISYFDYAAAKAELISGGFLELQNGNIKITDKGKEWAETFAGSLSRDLCECLTDEAERLKKETETAKICRTKIEGAGSSGAGDEHYYITAEIGEKALPVMSLRLYTPDRKNAEKIENAIKTDPFGVYERILKVIEKTGV